MLVLVSLTQPKTLFNPGNDTYLRRKTDYRRVIRVWVKKSYLVCLVSLPKVTAPSWLSYLYPITYQKSALNRLPTPVPTEF